MAYQGKYDGSWLGNWRGAIEERPPGFISGSATISINASGILSSPSDGFISGTASISIDATGKISGGEPKYSGEVILGTLKPRPKPQHQAIEELALELEEKQDEVEQVKSEKKRITRQKKQSKIRSPEYFELQTYEYLLTLQITQLDADLSGLVSQLQAMQAVNDRLAWQQQLAKEQSMFELDMAFIITMMAEA